MKIRKICLLFALCPLLITGCTNNSKGNEEDNTPKEVYTITMNKKSSKVGDKLYVSDFVVLDENSKPVDASKLKIEDLNLFSPTKQTIKIVNEEENKFGRVELTLEQRNSLKLLFFGNSYIQDSMLYSYQIAKNLGLEDVKITHNFLSGATLAQHLANIEAANEMYTFEDYGEKKVSTTDVNYDYGLAQNEYDFIGFHNTSLYETIQSSYKDMDKIHEYCENYYKDKANPNYLFNMSWSLQEGNPDANFAKKWDSDTDKMYQAIVDGCIEGCSTREYINGIMPIGTAIQNMRKLVPSKTYNRDNTAHLNNEGSLVAGLTLVCFLTGKDPRNCTFDAGFGDEFLQNVKNAVSAALNNPYQIIEG